MNHPTTTHLPQSLPSFAQAFSAPSLNSISAGNNSLPPIQSRAPTFDPHRANSPPLSSLSRRPSIENTSSNIRKRSRTDLSEAAQHDEDSGSGRQSPRLIRIKEEQDQDMLDASPQLVDPQDTGGTPAPSTLRPNSVKKRRVTVSGAPHPLNTDVRILPSEQPSSTPISPVVIGFTVQRDDPAALEQVRSTLSVKQKQKALIEQRRGSAAGILSSTTTTTAIGGTGTGPANPLLEERGMPTKSLTASRTARRSPNPVSGPNHPRRVPSQGGNAGPRPASPILPSQQQQLMQVPNQVSHGTAKNSLPAPPISFARRRAGQFGGGKKKPADIVISPREAHTQEQFQPAIQSAPPIPHAGQGQFYTGRFPMTLPRLPPIVPGNEHIRRPTAGHVPPTPSRLSMQRPASTSAYQVPSSLSGFPNRSPPASVAIATTLVPPTPASLHHPGYSGDKSAFLAPFSIFYDALNDSKQLKNWLGEQLQKSSQLAQSMTQQQEKLDDIVTSLVERKLAGVRDEIVGLHRRIEELEEALRVTTAELVHRRQSDDALGGFQRAGRQPVRGGSAHSLQESYTFPPMATIDRRRGEPIRKQSSTDSRFDQERESQSLPRSENGSPAPYNSRRLSVSAIRLDPVRLQPSESASQPPGTLAVRSPPLGSRDGSRLRHSPSPNARAKGPSLNSTPVLSSRNHAGPQTIVRQLSNSRMVMASPVADRPGSPMDAENND